MRNLGIAGNGRPRALVPGPMGDRLVVRSGGGGSYGRPERRAAERINRDAREGRQVRGAPASPPADNM